MLEEASRSSIDLVKNRNENLTSRNMHYIFNTEVILSYMWETLANHTWTGVFKNTSGTSKPNVKNTDSNNNGVSVDGFMRFIKHISAPRYPKFTKIYHLSMT